ncbi:hypothetical protein [Sedimentitalea todarodis]|uniref:Uncharacterized protein n=1 Tax=Sedimentitalea todarodis TaxID=1631240 RepID=A0ABU3V953_9RHOB|nr:hypothetical protein [Sedimentitalea todarodis]MDU9002690.1 hypothetical protein [Sedimentitalea todarodis]
MKYFLTLAIIALPVVSAAQDCRWAGGSYRGQELPFEVQIQVNADCTEVTMKSSGNDGIQPTDVAQTFPLTDGKHGWVADVNGVNATLAKDGDFVTFFGEGLDLRLQMRPM